jgi:hypothetical protein
LNFRSYKVIGNVGSSDRKSFGRLVLSPQNLSVLVIYEANLLEKFNKKMPIANEIKGKGKSCCEGVV